MPIPDTHTYVREIDLDQSNDSLAKIVRLVPAGCRVLDVGTGSGALGKFLSTQKQCHVDGVTYNPEEAAIAAAHYQRVEVIDLEQEALPDRLAGQRYDLIVCADVLEHLRNAPKVLADLAALLAVGGSIVLSIPNVTYIGVLLNLMAGRFARTQEGLLDATHVHFWDRHSLAALCEAAALKIVQYDAVHRNLFDSEFSQFNWLALPSAVRAYLQQVPDASVYQFIWTLQPVPVAQAEIPAVAQVPAIPSTETVPCFMAQLFLDRGDGFQSADCIDALGRQTEGRQTLVFDLVPGRPVYAVRLDLADRPGVMEFYGVEALDNEGQKVWEWLGDWTPAYTQNDCDWLVDQGSGGGRVVCAHGNDPWVRLPVDSERWTGVAQVRLTLSCPRKYDAAAFWHYRRRFGGEINMLRESLHAQASAFAIAADAFEAQKRLLQDQVNEMSAQVLAVNARLLTAAASAAVLDDTTGK